MVGICLELFLKTQPNKQIQEKNIPRPNVAGEEKEGYDHKFIQVADPIRLVRRLHDLTPKRIPKTCW